MQSKSCKSIPIIVRAGSAVQRLLGPDLYTVAGLALRTFLLNRRTIEVGYELITYRSHLLSFSSVIAHDGQLILKIDFGEPWLADEAVILEDDMRRAETTNRPQRGEERTRSGRSGRFR